MAKESAKVSHLVPKEPAKALSCSCQRNMPGRGLAHAKVICQGISLLMPKEPTKVRLCLCQGVALLVPKESAKAQPCSCRMNLPRRDHAYAKAQHFLCQGNLPGLARTYAKGRAKARYKSQPRLHPSTVPWPRHDLVYACVLPRPEKVGECTDAHSDAHPKATEV
ncbi:hypothetical protein Syun_021044 [Stephania yunnanensis]|uniref:Uncharacterized protein n=1 Tax=Stephania yunnanensis TaxID=152371 RepID=A0AAP0NNT3_9MAGN